MHSRDAKSLAVVLLQGRSGRKRMRPSRAVSSCCGSIVDAETVEAYVRAALGSELCELAVCVSAVGCWAVEVCIRVTLSFKFCV